MLIIRTVLLFIYFISLSITLHAQITIQGTVTNAKTGEPQPGVNVYLSNTTIGASTNSDGNYKIKKVPNGLYEIVFSYIGFKKQVKKLKLKNSSSPLVIDVALHPKVYEMKEAKVVSSNNKWKKQFATFKKEFIGKTRFAEKTTITNPWVINFKEDKNNTLTATAQEPIIVINKALGYKIHVELVKFKWSWRNQEAMYKMYPKFDSLLAETNNQQRNWIENRLEAYLGSFPHFLKELYNNTLQDSNFSVDWLSKINELKTGAKRLKLYESGLSPDIFQQFKGYKLDNKIQISFNKNYNYTIFEEKNSVSIRKESTLSPNTQDETFLVHKKGYLLNPVSLKVFGDWAKTRVADTLPFNYEYKQLK